MSLKGKTVLVSGASSGIGEACAKHFASAGANLVLIARRVERLVKLAEDLSRESGTRCCTGQVDVRDRPGIEKFVSALPDEFKSIDILVNNAGLARGFDRIHDGNHEDWDAMIDTNIKGVLNLTRVVTPGMISRGNGHIINIGSIAGRQVYPYGGVYCATKHAVRALTQGLMMDLVDTPVRVSTVDPGMVETEFALVRFEGDEQRAGSVYQGLTPLRADDIAEAILFCATRQPHVNIAEMVVLPTDQASAYHIHRRG